MDMKELRELLKKQNALWSLPKEMTGELDQLTGKEYSSGRLPEPPGMRETYMPRMRNESIDNFSPWVRGVFPTLRKTVSSLPPAWDWRNVDNCNWVTPVRNQGSCNSCVAFAVTGAVESHLMIEMNNSSIRENLDLSEALLFFSANRKCKPGSPNYGWYIPQALDLLVNEGICEEKYYPYVPEDQEARLVRGSEISYKVTGYDRTSKTTQMKRWLVEEGPLIAGFDLYEDFNAYWLGGAIGIYQHLTGSTCGGHAVIVVG